MLACNAHGLGDAFRVLRQHDSLRQPSVDRRVVFVHEQVLGRRKDPTAADCALEFPDQAAFLHALSLAAPFLETEAAATPPSVGASFYPKPRVKSARKRAFGILAALSGVISNATVE